MNEEFRPFKLIIYKGLNFRVVSSQHNLFYLAKSSVNRANVLILIFNLLVYGWILFYYVFLVILTSW